MALPIVAIAQINPTVGDISGNAAKITSYYHKAKAHSAELVVFPELAVTGYPPEDLVLMDAFCDAAMDAAEELAAMTKDGPAMVVGCVWRTEQGIANAALVLANGEVAHMHQKLRLPNYGVFDEQRVFVPGENSTVFEVNGCRIGLLVCEDLWSDEPLSALNGKADMVVSINASPYEMEKLARRQARAKRAAELAGAPFVYVNLIGGQDDLVFDGASFVVNVKSEKTAQLPAFAETLHILVELNSDITPPLSTEESVWEALMLGMGDYVLKNGFSTVVLGLSGGIDSALAATLAVDALGAQHVKGVLLPSPYTSDHSNEDAAALAKNLGIETIELPISEMMQTFEERLSPIFKESGWMDEVEVGGNLQARLRGISLMALSNRFGWLLLSTANKSELAVGYSTLYGDACGAFMPFKDVYKTPLYHLAKWRNGQRKVIPARSISKAPTAELKHGQKDEDQLPPYPELDAILERHLEGRQDAGEIIAAGFSREVVEKVLAMVRRAEYKRRQSPPGTKITSMLFGRERRFPLTNRFHYGMSA